MAVSYKPQTSVFYAEALGEPLFVSMWRIEQFKFRISGLVVSLTIFPPRTIRCSTQTRLASCIDHRTHASTEAELCIFPPSPEARAPVARSRSLPRHPESTYLRPCDRIERRGRLYAQVQWAVGSYRPS